MDYEDIGKDRAMGLMLYKGEILECEVAKPVCSAQGNGYDSDETEWLEVMYINTTRKQHIFKARKGGNQTYEFFDVELAINFRRTLKAMSYRDAIDLMLDGGETLAIKDDVEFHCHYLKDSENNCVKLFYTTDTNITIDPLDFLIDYDANYYPHKPAGTHEAINGDK